MGLFTFAEREYLMNSGFVEYSFTDEKTFIRIKRYIQKLNGAFTEQFNETKVFYDPNIVCIKNKFYQVYDNISHYNSVYNFFIKKESYAKYLRLKLSESPRKIQTITGFRTCREDLLVDLYYIKQKTESYRYFYTLKISGLPMSVEHFLEDILRMLFGKKITSVSRRKEAIEFIKENMTEFDIPRVFTTSTGNVFVYKKSTGLKTSNAMYLPNSIIQ
jgi:hypothetical protein